MKVAICFIGTGKYLNFLPKYYQHIQEYFLPNSEKTFLVFTDGELNVLPSNVIPYYQDHLSWPFITLNRFEFIKRAESEIKKNDWFIFIDADALVVDDIKEEEFFDESKPFFGVHHPCHFLKMNPHTQFPGALETNPESNAYVKEFKDFPVYFQGCLWGGKVPEVIDMVKELDRRTKEDLSKDIVAVWHDESHLNKFYIDNFESVNILGPEFAYPEVFSGYCEFEPRIIHLAKDNSKYQT